MELAKAAPQLVTTVNKAIVFRIAASPFRVAAIPPFLLDKLTGFPST